MNHLLVTLARATAILQALGVACAAPDWQLPSAATDRSRDVAPLVVGGRASTLTSARWIWARDCEPACVDADADGVSDAWEQALLQAVHPTLWLHADDGLFRDRRAALAVIGRVWPEGPVLHVVLVIAYTRDYGRCGSDSHPGDSERIALELTALPDGHSARVERWYTAAHEGTSYDASSSGTVAAAAGVFSPWGLDAPPDSLYVARDKHATYPSVGACRGRDVPCVDDVCAADVPLDVTPWNAGEPEAPLLDDLGPLGFPGQCAWCARPFCGDRSARRGCAAAVRDKLSSSPLR